MATPQPKPKKKRKSRAKKPVTWENKEQTVEGIHDTHVVDPEDGVTVFVTDPGSGDDHTAMLKVLLPAVGKEAFVVDLDRKLPESDAEDIGAKSRTLELECVEGFKNDETGDEIEVAGPYGGAPREWIEGAIAAHEKGIEALEAGDYVTLDELEKEIGEEVTLTFEVELCVYCGGFYHNTDERVRHLYPQGVCTCMQCITCSKRVLYKDRVPGKIQCRSCLYGFVN